MREQSIESVQAALALTLCLLHIGQQDLRLSVSSVGFLGEVQREPVNEMTESPACSDRQHRLLMTCRPD
jgi:hypothetical protein